MSDSAVAPAGGRAHRCRRLSLTALGLLIVVEGGSFVGGDMVNQLAETLPGADKLLHVLGFLGVSLGLRWATRRWTDRASGSDPITVLLVVAAVGDEIAQGFQPSRHLDWVDLVASLGGVVLGLAWAYRGVSIRRAMFAACLGLLASASTVTAAYFEGRHLAAGLRYEREGNFIEARREYRVAFEEGVSTSALLNELAWVEIESGEGDPSEAVKFAERALAMAPDDPAVRDTYGWALHHAGRAAEALPHLLLAFQADPEMFCIHYHLGEVYLALGQTDKAVAHLRRQVERTHTREAAKAARELGRLAAGR